MHFSTSCSKDVTGSFNGAIALLHSFQYEQAREAFVEVASKDPHCAMAYWGIAMTWYHPIWAPPNEKELAAGMAAAQKAAASGIPMVIASGRQPGALARLLAGEAVGTYFAPKASRLTARKRWIAFAVPPQGRLTVDAGARRALSEQNKSLLPSGVVDVEGDFAAGEIVAIVTAGGKEFARGLVNFDATECRKIRGAKTREIEERLGYRSFDEVVHRDNLVVL